MKGYNIKKNNKLKYLIIVFSIVFVIYVFFNFYVSTGSLSIESKTRLYDLGLVNNEKVLYGFYFPEYDRFGKLFRWSGKESELLLRSQGDTMVIPVFNPKPDLSEDPIHIKIYINGREVMEHIQTGNELFNIEIDLRKINVKKDDIINLKFMCNKTWSPKECGLSDDEREISFAVREINFID
ncbi:MAG: hypothetical protein IMZ60_04890 [Actinobacteria bacterium]|nr:hypothetical protein [Chloroflexota bacterium]MBE3128998.1 hypothetical protein [Actinomycetota bacterium]